MTRGVVQPGFVSIMSGGFANGHTNLELFCRTSALSVEDAHDIDVRFPAFSQNSVPAKHMPMCMRYVGVVESLRYKRAISTRTN